MQHVSETHMQWQPDWGLRARMGVTMFLLFALYIVFFAGVWLYTGGSILVAALLIGGFSLIQYYYSDKLVLRSMGAQAVEREEYPQLHGMVQRLSQHADLPEPTVAVADDPVPNAFATGRNQRNAVVCVTTGLLDTLDQPELEGVIAHELAHIKNRDMIVMTIASFLATLAFLFFRWGAFFGGGRRRNGGGILVAVLLSLVVWVVSYLLIRALSRYREYAADRGGAAITGNPMGLATALIEISDEMDKLPERDMREEAEMNALFIVPISKGAIATLFRTHPPTEKRVEQLRRLDRRMEGR